MKSIGKQLFKRCIVALLIVMLIISAIPVTFAADIAQTGGTVHEVTDEDSPIARIEVEDVSVVDRYDGYTATDWIINPDTGNEEEVRYFFYSAYPKMTLYMKNGSVIDYDPDENGSEIFIEAEWVGIDVYTGQSYSNQWTVGNTYNATVSILGAQAEYKVSVVPSPIERIEVEDVSVIEHHGGYYDVDWLYDPDTGSDYMIEYYYYVVYPEMTLYMRDGSVIEYDPDVDDTEIYIDGEWTNIRIDNDQSGRNQWTVGNAYTSTVRVLGAEAEYKVSVLPGPIERIEAEDVSVTDHWNGYYDSDWIYDPDTDDYDEVRYYRYDNIRPKLTLYLRDGSAINYDPDEDGSGVYVDGEWANVNIDSDQGGRNQWTVGNTYNSKVSVLGVEAEYKVTVVPGPIERIVAEDVSVISDCGGYMRNEYVYNPDTDTEEYVEYFYYNSFRPKMTIYMRDGSVIDYDPDTDGTDIRINGEWCYVEPDSDQSYNNQWTLGNTYPASVTLFGVTADFNVSVIDTPVKSMDLKYTRSYYPYQSGEWTTEGAPQSQKWFRYSCGRALSGTITMQDGTVITLDKDNTIVYNGNYYFFSYEDDQSFENQWGPGDHEVKVTALNFTATAVFTIDPSPVKSAQLTVLDQYEGLDSSNGNEYSSWDESWWVYDNYASMVSGTVTFNDGTTVTLNNQSYVNSNNYYSYFEGVDDQSRTNQWGVGAHQASLMFLGYDAPVTVNVLPNPVKSVTAEDMVLYEGLDSDNQYGVFNEYTYYPTLTIEFNDGSSIQTTSDEDGYDSVQFNGRYYYAYVNDDQSETNEWGVGTHYGTVSIMGTTCTAKVEIKENPVKAISVDKVKPVKYKDYYTSGMLSFSMNVQYKDGTTETKAVFGSDKYYGDSEYKNDSRIRVSLIDSEKWKIGKGNKFTVSYAGCQATAYAQVVSDQTWEYIDAEDGIIITKYNGTKTWADIPGTIDGKTVIGVYANAFPRNMESLSFANSVRYVCGNLSFPEMTYISFGTDFEQIDTDTVRYLPKLESIYVSVDNKNYTDEGCIVYNKDKTAVAAAAPAYKGVILIPKTVKNLDVLNDSIYSDLRWSVGGESDSYKVVDGVTYTKDMKTVITCDRSKTGDYVMPSTVESVSRGAFAGCGLTSVKFSDKVTDIAYRTFANCVSLKKVVMPKKLKTIDNGAFDRSSALTDLTLPNTVETIGTGAFANTKLEQELVLPDSLTSIGTRAFQGTGVQKVTIPSSVQAIGSDAFSRSALKEVRIDADVQTQGNNAFASCTDLQKLTLGNNVKSVENGWFSGCTALTDLIIEGGAVTVGDYAFSGCPLTNFTSFNKLSGDIGLGAFRNCKIKKAALPATVTAIAYNSFSGSKDLASVTLPKSLLKVDSMAFDNTAWLNSQSDGVVYLDSVMYCYKGAMPQNTSVSLKNGTLSIADYAFLNQSNLTSLTLPSGLKRIGDAEFYNTGITTLDIPASVEEIGVRAFAGCENLEAINVDPNNPYFTSVDGVLYNKDMTELIFCPKRNTDTFKLPKTVKKIDSFAFGVSGLKEVVILRDGIELEPYAIGFDIWYDLSPFYIPGRTYKAVYHPMKVTCHEDSPAAIYAEDELLTVNTTEESEFETGDADGNGVTDLMDATYIQACLVEIEGCMLSDNLACDIDKNGEIEVIDATFIQRWAANIPIPYVIGK